MIPLESAPQRIQLPERRLLVPEPTVKFDKLTPGQMGLAHGRIAERPPLDMLKRMIAQDSWEDHRLFFLGIKHNMDHDPNFGFSSMGEDMSQQGKAYAEGYTQGLRTYMQEHKVKPEDLEEYNPDSLVNAGHMDAFIDGLERVPYVGGEVLRTGLKDFVRTAPAPIGYSIGFAVGVSRDFGLPINFNGIPKNDPEYTAFLEGLSVDKDKMPPRYGSMGGFRGELHSFRLGNVIREIVEADPLPQAA